MAQLVFLLLVLWVGLTVSTVVDLQKRIYGGKDCNNNERKYHVSLTVYKDGSCHHCGGSLIKSQWILTAAHCKSRPMYAVLGVHSGSSHVEEIIDTITHNSDDIMLLKLKNPANIPPVLVPRCTDEPKLNDDVQVAGLSTYIRDGQGYIIPDFPSKLKCAEMKVVPCDHDEWDHVYNNNVPNVPQENRMCYRKNQVDTRPGDSGGGVIYKNKIYGVHVASGEEACFCEALSIRVCPYSFWIDQKSK